MNGSSPDGQVAAALECCGDGVSADGSWASVHLKGLVGLVAEHGLLDLIDLELEVDALVGGDEGPGGKAGLGCDVVHSAPWLGVGRSDGTHQIVARGVGGVAAHAGEVEDA